MRGREGSGLKSKEIALAGVILTVTGALTIMIGASGYPVAYLVLILFYPVLIREIKILLGLVALLQVGQLTLVVSEAYVAGRDTVLAYGGLVDPEAARWIYEILRSRLMAFYFIGLILILASLIYGQIMIKVLEIVGYYRRLEALREALNL